MPSNHELIAAIYAATLSPNDFEATFDRLDALIFPDQGSSIAAGGEAGAVDSVALAHIDIARNIQRRIGQAGTQDQKLGAIVESVSNPSCIMTRTEQVLAANRMAVARHGRAPANLDDLVRDETTRGQIRKHLNRKDAIEPLTLAGFIDASQGGPGRMVISGIDASLVDGMQELFLVSVVDFGFDDTSVRLFREAYGLSAAESQVAVMLASGLRPAEIAKRRSASMDTVRTQIKSIKSKTSVRHLPELVRLLCGFAAGILTAAPTARTTTTVRLETAPVKLRRRIVLRDGRNLDYLEQGAKDGSPVILFHNVPYGVELPSAAIVRAHQEGLRVIAPFRPGFGRSDPLTGLGQDELITRTAEDLRELMQQLGLRRATMVSHSTGAPFALRFARLFPEAVSQLIGISRGPIWREEWIGQTPQRQRFMLRLSRRLPQLVPVAAWAMVACMDSRFANEFVAHACKDGGADSSAVRNPETLDLIAHGCVDALRLHMDALYPELLIVQTDFTEEARGTPHKFRILHGDEDRIVPLSQSLTFAEEVPGTSIEIVSGAGQLLFYSHWQSVLAAILADRTKATGRQAAAAL